MLQILKELWNYSRPRQPEVMLAIVWDLMTYSAEAATIARLNAIKYAPTNVVR